MHSADEMLGEPYVHNDNSAVNDGYPVFSWQYVAPDVSILHGDLYKDDKLSVMDLIVLQRHLVTLDTISEEQFPVADMNADGNVDIFDLALLKHAVLAQKKATDSAKAAEQIGLTG